MTAVKDLDEASLKYGWPENVEKRDLYFKTASGVEKVSPYHCQIVDADRERAMGVVGTRYVVVPYKDALSPCLPMLAAGARIVGGGAPNLGERCYLILEADGVVKLSKGDNIVNRFILSSSHDGTGKIELRMSPYRPRTGTALTIDSTHPLAFKHTRNVGARVAHARKAFSRVNEEWMEFTKGVQKMVSVPMSERDAQAFIEQVIPSASDSTRIQNIRESIYLLYTTYGTGTRLPKCRGTLFGLVQAFAEWADLKRTVRKSNRRDDVAAALDAKLFADSAKKKQKAWAMALYLADQKKMSGALSGVGGRK
jgi:phage/plasmid-like protein (TIGR03299 family)